MKRKPIKNRKKEVRNKRLLFSAIFLSIVLLSGSICFVALRFFMPPSYISPIPVQVGDNANINAQKNTIDLEIGEKLSQANISYKQIKLVDSSCQVTLTDGSEVIFSTTKDFAAQIASLQLITTRLTMEGKRFSRLDLRYNQPVLWKEK